MTFPKRLYKCQEVRLQLSEMAKELYSLQRLKKKQIASLGTSHLWEHLIFENISYASLVKKWSVMSRFVVSIRTVGFNFKLDSVLSSFVIL